MPSTNPKLETSENELKNPHSLRSKKKFAAMGFAAAVFYILMELKYEHFLIMRYRFELKEMLKRAYKHVHGHIAEFTREQIQTVSNEIDQLKKASKKIETIMEQIEQCKTQLEKKLEPIKEARKTQINEIKQILHSTLDAELKNNKLPPHLLSVMIESVDSGLSERPTLAEAIVIYSAVSEESASEDVQSPTSFEKHFAETYSAMDELIIREKIKNVIKDELLHRSDDSGKQRTEAQASAQAFKLAYNFMKNPQIAIILTRQIAKGIGTKEISELFDTLQRLSKEGEKIHKDTHQQLKSSHSRMSPLMNGGKQTQTRSKDADETPTAVRAPQPKSRS